MPITADIQFSTDRQACACRLDLTRDPAAPFLAAAARYRALAAEAQLQALVAIRTNPEAIQRTEAAYRGLVLKQARNLKHARRLEKRINARAAQ